MTLVTIVAFVVAAAMVVQGAGADASVSGEAALGLDVDAAIADGANTASGAAGVVTAGAGAAAATAQGAAFSATDTAAAVAGSLSGVVSGAEASASGATSTPPPLERILATVLGESAARSLGSTTFFEGEGGIPAIGAAQAATAAAASVAGAGLWFAVKNALAFVGSRALLAPMFSRIDKKTILENEAREMMHDLVRENPGIGLMELSEATGLGWGTTVYHMGRLENAGLVASMKHGQNRHFFLNGHPAAQSKTAIAVLKNDTAANVARFVMAHPGATQAQIARELDIKPPTVTKYVKRLEAEQLLDTVPDGRTKIVQATGRLFDVFGTMEPTMPQPVPDTAPPTAAGPHNGALAPAIA